VLWEEYVLRSLKKHAEKHSEEKWVITGQESKKFYGSHRTIRPDIVLRKGDETIIIDTKWKRPTNKVASIEDLRQMYAYGRFWNTDKLVLLYPGETFDSGYKNYPNQNDHETEFHQCKIAMVNVIRDGVLSEDLAEDIMGVVD
jgi:5-methylcytosine-specific restriction enzyme subunit McrC